MSDLLQYLTAFGLAAGAGSKATVPVLAIGLFHYSPWFELAPQWEWIASPPVMIILGGLFLLEMWADSHPELGGLSDYAAYAPAAIAGFLAFASAIGEVDDSLMELVISGVLGSTTSTVVRVVRNKVRRGFRDSIEMSSDHAGRAVTAGETGAAAVVSAAAIVAPVGGIIALGLTAVMAWWLSSITRRPMRPCPTGSCTTEIHPDAVVCPKCGSTV
jgi:hypothetical protein